MRGSQLEIGGEDLADSDSKEVTGFDGRCEGRSASTHTVRPKVLVIRVSLTRSESSRERVGKEQSRLERGVEMEIAAAS